MSTTEKFAANGWGDDVRAEDIPVSGMVSVGGNEELCARERLESEWTTAACWEEELCAVGGLGNVWYTMRRWEDDACVVGTLESETAGLGRCVERLCAVGRLERV